MMINFIGNTTKIWFLMKGLWDFFFVFFGFFFHMFDYKQNVAFEKYRIDCGTNDSGKRLAGKSLVWFCFLSTCFS